jgi:hypothetical protein
MGGLKDYRHGIDDEGNSFLLVEQGTLFQCCKCGKTIRRPEFFLCKEDDLVYCDHCVRKGCNWSGVKNEHIDFCIRAVKYHEGD